MFNNALSGKETKFNSGLPYCNFLQLICPTSNSTYRAVHTKETQA